MLNRARAILNVAAFAGHARIRWHTKALVLFLPWECAAFVCLAVTAVDNITITNRMHFIAASIRLDVHGSTMRMVCGYVEIVFELIGQTAAAHIERLCYRRGERAGLTI